ncbi:MAG: hypothetical protein PVF50_08030 [Gammaproteobacteria bacterium]|jgi:hypothetical protein
MAEEQDKDKEERPFVERWLEEQKEWQKTMLTYMDTMANNEEFLVHLGNAMRGSLLAGKPYPGTTVPDSAETDAKHSDSNDRQADERLDRILFTLHELQGQLNDLQLTVDRLLVAQRNAGGPAPVKGAADAGNDTAAEAATFAAPPGEHERDS